MKKLIITSCLVGLIAIFTACKKEPLACFSTNMAETTVGTPVTADGSCSDKAEKYMWFAVTGGSISGNGSSATETYTFSAPGTYTIKLEVTNGKKSSTITHNVVVN